MDYERAYAELVEAVELGLFGLAAALESGEGAEHALRIFVQEVAKQLPSPQYALEALSAGFSIEDALKVEGVVRAAERGRTVAEVPANVVSFTQRIRKASQVARTLGTNPAVGTTDKDERILELLRAGWKGEDIYREVKGRRATTMRRIKELRRLA